MGDGLSLEEALQLAGKAECWTHQNKGFGDHTFWATVAKIKIGVGRQNSFFHERWASYFLEVYAMEYDERLLASFPGSKFPAVKDLYKEVKRKYEEWPIKEGVDYARSVIRGEGS